MGSQGVPVPVLIVAAVVAGLVGLYAIAVYNELTQRYQRLQALLGQVRVTRARRFAVGSAVRSHLGRSARHVEKATRHAARGKAGGRHTKVNMDGFPEQRVVELARKSIAADVASCDRETEAQVTLRREAAEYNSRLRSFPCCLVARLLNFRPWVTHRTTQRPRGLRRG